LGERDEVGLLGPLGHGFPDFGDDSVLGIAGGVGTAPFGMYSGNGQIEVIVGARAVADAAFADALRDVDVAVRLATDDGSAGFHGTCVQLAVSRIAIGDRPDRIYCCGPVGMMQAVAELARQEEIAAWFSLEERMACGIGVCRGCVKRDAEGKPLCVCTDGPVVPLHAVF